MARAELALAIALVACRPQAPPPRPSPGKEVAGQDLETATPLALALHAGAPIAPDDPDAAIAREEEARLREGHGEWVTRTVPPARRIASTALRDLFPGCRFLLLSWQDRAVDPARHPVHIAFGLYSITAVSPDGSRSRHFCSGEHESFGKLLADARVAIRTEEEARLVWRAYCDLFGGSWTQPCERGSATSWRLGISEVGGRRYWYEVAVDAEGRAVSGRLRSG